MSDMSQQVKIISVLSSGDDELACRFFEENPHLLDAPIGVLSGWTPVVYCIQNSRPQLLRNLLELGASANEPCALTGSCGGGRPFRPLQFAIAAQNQPCWDILLDHGADVNLTSGRGVSALMSVAAIAYTTDFSVKAFNDVMAREANVHHIDDAGNTVSHYAAVSGSQLVFERLQEKGVDVLEQLSLGMDCYKAIEVATPIAVQGDQKKLQLKAILSRIQQQKIDAGMRAIEGLDEVSPPTPSRSLRMSL